MLTSISNRLRHFFHVVSNVRPIVWIGLYVLLMPIFAFIYWGLPDSQFRIPDGATTDYGSWLYYSIVTITTLGFGDYTPAHGWAQGVTAVEVMCGLIILGFFLNAVGSMKSEIDVESELEKQRLLHKAEEKEKLVKTIPSLMHTLNTFLAYCYAVTTPGRDKDDGAGDFNPDFSFSDLSGMFAPSGLPIDHSTKPAVERLMSCASRTSLFIDSLQTRVDLTLWPALLEDCFGFVANYQLFSAVDIFNPVNETEAEKKSLAAEISEVKDPAAAGERLRPVVELYHFIRENGALARDIETKITSLVSAPEAE